MTNKIKTFGNATINRYFEVGTINRTNRLKLVNCSTKFITVSLIKFAIRNLPVKEHLKKNHEAEKLDGNLWGIKFPIDYRRVFFLIVVFFGVHFYGQTPVIYLHYTVSMVRVTDPEISGAWLG